MSTWDRVMPGVSVLDVSLSGLTEAEAQARLAPRMAELLDQPLVLKYADRSWSTSPRGMGVRLDPADLAHAAFAVGRAGAPRDALREQLEVWRAGHEVP